MLTLYYTFIEIEMIIFQNRRVYAIVKRQIEYFKANTAHTTVTSNVNGYMGIFYFMID